MNKFIFLLIQPLFLFSLEAAEKMLDTYYVLPSVSKEELKDMNLASSFIAKTFKNNYFTGVNLIYTQDEKTYIQSYIKGKQDMLGLHLLSVAEHYSDIKPITKYYYIHSLNKDLFEEYIILSKNVSNIKTIKGLRGVTDGSQNSDIFSDMTCLSVFKKECKNILTITKSKKPQEAILKVYFDQADIAFVPLRNWEVAQNLNPSLSKKMQIVAKSPKVFTFGAFLMRINVKEENLAMLKKVNDDMSSKPDAKQLLFIAKVKSTKLVSTSEIDPIIAYYLKYVKLKKSIEKDE